MAEAYTCAELGWWVHLLVKRAHRFECGLSERNQDLADARMYHAKLGDLIQQEAEALA